MAVIAMRDLTRKTREVVEEVRRTGKPAIVTQYGRPAVALIPVPPEAAFEDLVLAHAPRFLQAMSEADADAAAGRTTTLSALKRDLAGDARTTPRVSGSAGGARAQATARKRSRQAGRRTR